MEFNWNDLNSNSISQLKTEAAALSIYIPPRTKKSEMIRILEQEKSRLLSPQQNLLMGANSPYERNYSPSQKIDIHKQALESIKTNSIPSIPPDVVAKVFVDSIPPSPYANREGSIFSPVLNSPNSIPLKKPMINENFEVPFVLEDSASSQSNSRQQSPILDRRHSNPSNKSSFMNENERFSTPTVTKERSITPLQYPIENKSSKQYRISLLTKIMNIIFMILTLFSFLVLISTYSPGAFLLFVFSLILFLMVRILRNHEIQTKAQRLANSAYAMKNIGSIPSYYNPDKVIYNRAKEILRKSKYQ